jgi:ribosomal protein S6--L-glutamate ligase
MILSYHPCYVADENRICAERPPGAADQARMRAADAVILPQGCKPALYAMAKRSAAHIFPNYDVRFGYPGKSGQIRLFRELKAPHPATRLYNSLADFDYGPEAAAIAKEIGYPLVFKLDFGGEGETVARIDSPNHLRAYLQTASGRYQGSFLLQRHIATDQRSLRERTLRVVVIGKRLISYWRENPDPDSFGTSAGKGAHIDHEADPRRQHLGREAVRAFCSRSGIDLAGFDLLFQPTEKRPLFLEINHYFGRRGLGGSAAFYEILTAEIDRWLAQLPLGNRLQEGFSLRSLDVL